MNKLQDEMFSHLFQFVGDMETRSDRFEMFAVLKVLYKQLGVPNMTLKEVENLVDKLNKAVDDEFAQMNVCDICENNL